MEEKWVEVPGCNGRYFASSLGRIKTIAWKGKNIERVMKPAPDKKGYLRTVLLMDGKLQTVKVHRIIAACFIPNPEGKPQVNHINFDRADNRVENLEWCTRRENHMHSYSVGRIKKPVYNLGIPGSKNGMAKLTEDKVAEIRSKFRPRIYTRKMLAAEYGVSPATIKDAILRRWKHVG